MDGQKTGSSLNGANGSDSNDNEAKEKVNKTLLLRQKIEENKYVFNITFNIYNSY